MSPDRRNDFDVTDTVQVSSPTAVRDAVRDLFTDTYSGSSFDPVWLAFHDCERLFEGDYPGYVGCDTTYHDLQHTLDMTLALARLIAGYERIAEPDDRLGADRARMTLITSLFHDAGYIRHRDRDSEVENGAELTLQHVSRSADFLRRYLPEAGLADYTDIATTIVHFTGYERNIDEIELEDPRDTVCGHLLGTADLIAQMADRCYLEKCRDHLYREFVLGGLAVVDDTSGDRTVHYESGHDLLRQTPVFFRKVTRERLQMGFNRSYRYVEVLFDGANPYVEAISNNMRHLVRVLENDDWRLLRRNPEHLASNLEAVARIDDLVASQLASFFEEPDDADARVANG